MQSDEAAGLKCPSDAKSLERPNLSDGGLTPLPVTFRLLPAHDSLPITAYWSQLAA
jgi:hypothetical protein